MVMVSPDDEVSMSELQRHQLDFISHIVAWGVELKFKFNTHNFLNPQPQHTHTHVEIRVWRHDSI